MAHLRVLRLLGCILIVLGIAACDIVLPNSPPSAAPTPSYSLGSLRLGDSVIRQRTSPYRVRNCQGTNNPLRVSSGYSLSNAVEWRVGSRAGFGVQIGNDAIPVSISLEAALDGQIAAQVTSSGNGETELTLSGSPNAIVEYEIHWFETWQSATIPLIPPIGDAIPIEVVYLTNLQPEITNETVIECPNAPQTMQSPTQSLPERTVVAPTPTISGGAQRLCPIAIARSQIESWDIGFAEVSSVQSYIEQFDAARQGNAGAYPTGTVIPAGVVVATNFDERDANAWREYPVRPIVHSGSWGLFETLGEYTAPNAGACRYID